MRYISLLLLLLAAVPGFAMDASGDDAFETIRERLIKDGISKETVDHYFQDDRFHLIPQLLRINIKQTDASSAYEKFVQKASVRETADYLKHHRDVFDTVLKDSHTDPEIVAAILRVESSLGKYKGKYRLMNVFASLSLLDSEQIEVIAPAFWDHVLKDSQPEEEQELRKLATKRAARKARWAFGELKTLLEMAESGVIDPLDARGSWAGAYGLPQFLPSSMKAYAVDGDGDGKIDLMTLHDAIASVDNYLARHGYRKENIKKRRKAIHHYNHSEDYVTCIITLADRVEEQLKG